MSRLAPYIQRRGYGLTFRIAVPTDLRSIVGGCEITKALPTALKTQAVPMAFELAATAKRLFCELRAHMTSSDEKKLLEIVQRAKHKLEIDALKEEHRDEIIEQHKQYLQKDKNAKKIDKIKLHLKEKQHSQEIQQTKLAFENEALKRALADAKTSAATTSTQFTQEAPAALKTPPAPMFKTIVDKFLNKYAQGKKPAMFKKHKPVLTMLLEIVGNKPITELKQADLNDFFELLGKLPPRWSDECRKRKLTIRQLAKLKHQKTLGPKTIEYTYIASVRPFLEAAKKDWQDQGFPERLTVAGNDYQGVRESGESRQRAFKLPELKRLFEGEEMRSFAADENLAHLFWLPHIGLFTGARVNEICQLNPQTDIIQDPDTDIWYFWFTEETEADVGIVKSIKTGDSRKVPMHSKLIELGFCDYLKSLKLKGAKRLFPAWNPSKDRASGAAEKWFRKFLRDLKLRDDTPKQKITGMHAFRHTLLTYGAMQKPQLNLTSITGHAQDSAGATGAAKGYFDQSLLNLLANRKALLDQLNYGISFHRPVACEHE